MYWRGGSGRIRVLSTYIAFYDSLCGRLIFSTQLIQEIGLEKGNILKLEYLGWRLRGGGENGKERVYCFFVGKKSPGEAPLMKLSTEERNEYLAVAVRPPEKTGGLRSRQTTAATQQGTQNQQNKNNQLPQQAQQSTANGTGTREVPRAGPANGTAAASTDAATTATATAITNQSRLILPPPDVPTIFDILIKKGQDADRLCVKTLVMKPLLKETLDLTYPLRTTIDIELQIASQRNPLRTTLMGFPGSRVAFLGEGKKLCKDLHLHRRDFLRIYYKGYREDGGGENGTAPVYCFNARKKVTEQTTVLLERGERRGKGERVLPSSSGTSTDLEEESEADSEETEDENDNEDESSGPWENEQLDEPPVDEPLNGTRGSIRTTECTTTHGTTITQGTTIAQGTTRTTQGITTKAAHADAAHAR